VLMTTVFRDVAVSVAHIDLNPINGKYRMEKDLSDDEITVDKKDGGD
jgi:hypothetical protein